MNQWISAVNSYYYPYMIYHVSHERLVFPELGIAGNDVIVQHKSKVAGKADPAPIVVNKKDLELGRSDIALQDGWTSGNGLGLGLPGARRLVDEFDIESTPSVGTTVTLVKWSRAR